MGEVTFRENFDCAESLPREDARDALDRKLRATLRRMGLTEAAITARTTLVDGAATGEIGRNDAGPFAIVRHEDEITVEDGL